MTILEAKYFTTLKSRSSGVRFDIRTRRGERPEEYALNWTNQWSLKNGIRIRGILIASRQFGSDNAADGTAISTPSSISTKLYSRLHVGLEMFNEYGELGNSGSFNAQSHQIGPMLGGTLPKSMGGLKYEFRYLAGVSNGSLDHNLGLRFNKAF